MIKWILSLLVASMFTTAALADCHGVSAPAKQRVSIFQKIRAVRAASCSSRESTAAASCSGPAQAASCSQSVMSVAPAPEPEPVVFLAPIQVAPVFVIEAAPVCENGKCSVVRNIVTAPARMVANAVGVAQAKANQQASEGRMRHVGGSMGAGRYEGVGFSTESADAAIRQCCYWGQRNPVDIGVQRGSNGWYATVLYN